MLWTHSCYYHLSSLYMCHTFQANVIGFNGTIYSHLYLPFIGQKVAMNDPIYSLLWKYILVYSNPYIYLYIQHHAIYQVLKWICRDKCIIMTISHEYYINCNPYCPVGGTGNLDFRQIHAKSISYTSKSYMCNEYMPHDDWWKLSKLHSNHRKIRFFLHFNQLSTFKFYH